MLLRSGSKRLHIWFFVVSDAHGPCVHKYLLLSHCQGGALNRDFRSVHVVCWINNFYKYGIQNGDRISYEESRLVSTKSLSFPPKFTTEKFKSTWRAAEKRRQV